MLAKNVRPVFFATFIKMNVKKDFIHQDEAPGIYYSTSIVQVGALVKNKEIRFQSYPYLQINQFR